MNYTNPKNPHHLDNPREWLNGSLIFARTLSLFLEENKGIVIDLFGDMYNPVGNSNKVIVFKMGGQIFIDNFSQDLPEGTICEIVEN